MPPRRRGPDSGRDELSRLLIELRGARTQHEAADLGGISQSKVTRAERGKNPLPTDEAVAYAAALGADPAQLARVEDLSKARHEENLRGRATLIRIAAAIQERIGRLEDDASEIRCWDPEVVTGVAQTTGYTAAMVAGVGVPDPGRDWWAARRARAQLVHEPGRVWHLVMSEAVLGWTLGDRRVMADQMRHLIELSYLPTVRLGIVELATPKTFVAPAAIMLFDEHTATAATEVGTSFLEAPDPDVATLRGMFDQVADAAVYGDDARRVLSAHRG